MPKCQKGAKVVKGYYQGPKYVSEFKAYAYSGTADIKITTNRESAYKTDLGEAADIAKVLRSMGFYDISIEDF